MVMGPQRAIQTGIDGPVEVRRAKVRDRAHVEADQKIRFLARVAQGGHRLIEGQAQAGHGLRGPRLRLRRVTPFPGARLDGTTAATAEMRPQIGRTVICSGPQGGIGLDRDRFCSLPPNTTPIACGKF
jgi:hypothetical protein